jgi:large subunit ribosomal protein L6
MSRVGKKPVVVPAGVSVKVDGTKVSVKGPKGELTYSVHAGIKITEREGQLSCEVAKQSKKIAALWGTTRARLYNLVQGVSEGYEKKLEIRGVGYRASLKGGDVELSVGFSHPVLIKAPEGISFKVEKEVLTVAGIDKVLVGQVAADIRAVRPPEPYKGKGIRYVGENVRRKVGKAVGTTG